MNKITMTRMAAPVDQTDAAALDAIETALLIGSLDAQQALQRAFPPNKPAVYRKTVRRFRDLRRKVRWFDQALVALDQLRQPSARPVPAVSRCSCPCRFSVHGRRASLQPLLRIHWCFWKSRGTNSQHAGPPRNSSRWGNQVRCPSR